MRAKEYYEKYHDGIVTEDIEASKRACFDMLVEMSSEAKDLAEKRHSREARSLASLIREGNNKWNAVARLFEKNHGGSPIKEDGFLNFWLNKMPELAPFIK